MKKIRVLLLVLILITSVSSVTIAQSKSQNTELKIENQEESKELSVDDYWEELKKKADELYCKANLSMEISTLVYEDGEFGGEAKVEVPIFNGDRRKKIKKEKMEFLDKGAELLSELEVNLSSLEVLKEKEAYLRALLTTDGAKSIDAYHDVREEVAKVRAEIHKVRRKLEVMLM
ncbi:hypothetical protein SAMN06265827_12846 [Orenia metallireducens]|uniref:Uncharacterized protein n=1 Tax=Orenia metallireducens TaxID=1413210 RepID=A0A285I2Y7_9FIRM|nr:hypothetical protein [Orenia metallireducens]SNY41436.1 hypothetical protein SAMN06265827_12846 [Orenia metallireducens]